MTAVASGILIAAAVLSDRLPAEPVLRLGVSAAAAGESSLAVPLEVLPVGKALVAGWSAVVSYDPRVMTATDVENARRADVFGFRTFAKHAMPGVLVVWAVYTLGDDTSRMLSEATGGVVANLKFCVLDSASTGTYALNFLPVSPQDHRYLTTATSAFEGTYTTTYPIVEAGAVAISGESVTGDPCSPEVPDPPPPPPVLKGTFQLRDQSAIRGLPVSVPFSIEAEERVFGFSFSVDFDEDVLEAKSVRPEYRFDDPNGARSEYERFEWNNSRDVPGNGGVDEGYVTGAVVFDLSSQSFSLPSGQENEVLTLSFLVNRDAPLGPTELRFEDGGRFLTIAQRNAFLAAGNTVYPEFIPASVLVNARISIIGDVSPFTPFVRGDSNLDGKVDIADGVRTFMFLFLGAEAPACLDAADATDDGVVDISDGIRVLNFIFGPGGAIPTPGPRECGPDGTADGLGCKVYPHCSEGSSAR